ncbi:peptide-methionine (S)-S-oxide reductase MsrA [Mucilaginibacter lacusdianchii]|uniref:peptide-methionine (S)-S-oxide reductase MsrA n=1 Tax=Mucilaginibacter lacusdianchii TaxID=2684211 RepID=UPI001E4F2A74|nr:peptide-methionine (S)-S-oxide reductase MsrA [Mucilaginibacter sp. JXJ CY 39]
MMIYIAGILLLGSCANGQANTNHKDNDKQFASAPQPKAGEEVTTFGGGCFWATSEAMLELKGVNRVIAGYAGGTVKNPTYEQVCTETTGHAEVVQVYYNPKVISYETLMKAFFSAHDPTTLNRQGWDEGTSYRSIAFYRTPQEKETIAKVVNEVNASKHYPKKVVTQVEPFRTFYPAEKYHQGYFREHLDDNSYLTSVSLPKIVKMRKAMKAQLKPEFQK